MQRNLIAQIAVLSLAAAVGCGDEKANNVGKAQEPVKPAVVDRAAAPEQAGLAPETRPAPERRQEPAATEPMKPVATADLPPMETDAPLHLAPQDAVIVTGKVTFKGDRPKRRKIDLSKDPKCIEMHEKGLLTESEVVNKDTLGAANVFVYVKSGYDATKKYSAQKPVLLDQKGCRYEPHVFGMLPGQEIVVRNSDDTTHNIHALPSKSKEFNFTQNTKGKEDKATFDNPEMKVVIKCDIHDWMKAYAYVMPHPFFGVSDEKGEFRLQEPLPPGDYEVAAIHEEWGASAVQKVAVGKDMKPLEIVFEKK